MVTIGGVDNSLQVDTLNCEKLYFRMYALKCVEKLSKYQVKELDPGIILSFLLFKWKNENAYPLNHKN